MHHSTAHATKLAPIDKQCTVPTEAKVGIAPECSQIGSRGARATPRRPQARPDTTTPAHKLQWGSPVSGGRAVVKAHNRAGLRPRAERQILSEEVQKRIDARIKLSRVTPDAMKRPRVRPITK